ncbi:MAG: type II secretion system F family protein [Candidatus Nanopelagicales bacterium]
MGALVGLLFAIGVATVLLVWHRHGQGEVATGSVVEIATAARQRRRTVNVWLKRIGIAILAAIATAGITGLLSLALLAAGVSAMVPALLAKRRANAIALQVEAAWPDVIDSIISSVRAGMSLPESLCALASQGPEPLRASFSKFTSRYRTTANFEESVANLKAELSDPVGDRVCEALLAARDVGGTDLGRTMRSLGDFIRQDLRFRGEARARQSWTINGARLAVGAPWVVLILLCTRPGTTAAYATWTGTMIILISAAVTVLAYWLMMRLGSLPKQPRFVA